MTFPFVFPITTMRLRHGEVTARHVYVRGHGPDGRYKDHYSDKTLRAWARHIVKWRRQRRTVFVYFDNDQKSAAPADARRLVEMLQRARP